MAPRVVTVASSFLIARLLGREVFGEFGVVTSTTALIGSLAGFGVGTTATKYVASLRHRDPVRTGRIIGLSTIVTCVTGGLYAALFLLFAPWLAANTLGAPHLAGLLRLNALSVLLGVVNGAQTSSLCGFEAFRANAYVSASMGVLQAIASIAGCWLDGLRGLIIAVTLGLAATTLVNRLVLSRQMRNAGISIPWHDCHKEWRVLWSFSIPAFLASTMVAPAFWACNAMLANQPNGYYELGALSAANQWYTAVLLLPSMLTTAVLPVLSERHSAGDHRSTSKVMLGMMKVTAAVVIPIALTLCALSKVIMGGYGESFAGAHWVLIASVLTAAMLAIIAPVGQMIAASGRMWDGLWMNAAWAAVLLLLTWLMLPWGASGLAWSRFLAYVAHSIWTITYVVVVLQRRVRASVRVEPAADGTVEPLQRSV